MADLLNVNYGVVRGKEIAMIFQDALSALNPVFTVGYQIAEMFRVHRRHVQAATRQARAIELLDQVGIPAARQRVNDYPHQFSGGMRQRIDDRHGAGAATPTCSSPTSRPPRST